MYYRHITQDPSASYFAIGLRLFLQVVVNMKISLISDHGIILSCSKFVKKVQRGHERTEEELVFKLNDKEQFSLQGCVLPQSILPHVQHNLVLPFKSYNERDAILK